MLDVVQKALQRLPDELHIVERCMKALHPLTSDEYYNCFHSSGRLMCFFTISQDPEVCAIPVCTISVRPRACSRPRALLALLAGAQMHARRIFVMIIPLRK
jgi:hypothetical protein